MRKLAIIFAQLQPRCSVALPQTPRDNTVKAKAATDVNSIINRHQLAPSTLGVVTNHYGYRHYT